MLQGVHGFGEAGEGAGGGDEGAVQPPQAFKVQAGLALSKSELLAQLSEIEAKMNPDQTVCSTSFLHCTINGTYTNLGCLWRGQVKDSCLQSGPAAGQNLRLAPTLHFGAGRLTLFANHVTASSMAISITCALS